MKILFAFALIAGLAACSDSSAPSREENGAGKLHSREVGVAMDQVAVAPQAAASAAPNMAGSSAFADSLRPAMLIRNGYARIEVDSLEEAVARVHGIAQRLGGQVTGVATQTGAQQVRESTLILRIPAPRFDEALRGLEPLGDVESVNVTSEDVGEEYVDIGVRLENGRRLERRLLDLLQTRAGKLEEVLAVERELARIREEIERYEGRMRYLRSRADVSTLTVTVHEPVPLLSNYQGQNVLTHSLARAWRNFVGLVAGVIASLGIIIPVGIAMFVAWWLIRRRRRT